jgi:predicted GNAT superfamily acetyltransferase
MEFRDLKRLADLRQVVELERRIWGYANAEDLVPVPILVVSVKRGGILIGAFDAQTMVGFVYSLAGLKTGRPMQWSHMLGVLDPYRNAGLGFQLKLLQRSRALAMEQDLVEWTFDPLQAPNAHFNLRKLGVVVEEYRENVYGDSSSPLHRGAPTDRFIAEWWIRSPRVDERVAGRGGPTAGVLEGAVPVLRALGGGDRLDCGEPDLAASASRLVVEIPTGFTGLLADDPPPRARLAPGHATRLLDLSGARLSGDRLSG